MLRKPFVNFLAIVLLPLLLAGGGTVWLMSDLVSMVSTGANNADHQRTLEVVASAIQAARQQMENVVSDNANWDDAAVETFAPQINDTFISAVWGAPTVIGTNYDAVLITDAEGRVLAAKRQGADLKFDTKA